MKLYLSLFLAASATAFTAPNAAFVRTQTKLFNAPHLGAGGMADTRDPDAYADEDPRKSISAAPSFEEYMKMRDGGAPAPAPAAPAPAPAAPAPVAPPPAAAAPAPKHSGPVIGAGGMADTRDPEAYADEDPRKSISAAPSFEEYMKMRSGSASAAAAPAAPAPAVAAPAAPAPAAAPVAAGGGGSLMDTLASLEGPGQVWGADGIAVGKEENDLKGYDNFGKFFAALQSTGVANEIAGAGPFTIFAPTDSALVSYEKMKGPVDAAICRLHIVPGLVASSDVSSADLTSLGGVPLHYRYAVRKHFVNDAIIGEKTFGVYSDFPIDVKCSNGVIHSVGLCFGFY